MIARTLLFGALFCAVATAQRAPRGTFEGKDFAAAIQEAEQEGKPIAVIFTETESSCPKCYSATEIAFKEMRSKFVLVLADQRVDKQTGGLPPEVIQKTYPIYRTKGNVTPIISVFSSDGEKVLSGACYKQIAADERKWLKDLEEEVAAAKEASGDETPGEPEPPEPEITGAGSGEMRDWTDIKGRTMVAELLGSDIINATFKLSSGKVVDVPLSSLSEESRALVEDKK